MAGAGLRAWAKRGFARGGPHMPGRGRGRNPGAVSRRGRGRGRSGGARLARTQAWGGRRPRRVRGARGAAWTPPPVLTRGHGWLSPARPGPRVGRRDSRATRDGKPGGVGHPARTTGRSGFPVPRRSRPAAGPGMTAGRGGAGAGSREAAPEVSPATAPSRGCATRGDPRRWANRRPRRCSRMGACAMVLGGARTPRRFGGYRRDPRRARSGARPRERSGVLPR